MANRVAGIMQFKANGEQYLAKGSFTYGYGREVRTTIVGADAVHGYRTAPIAPFIEGELTDDGSINVDVIANLIDATITLELANGKIFSLEHAWSVNPDGLSVETEESNMSVRFEGRRAKDIR